MFGRIVNQSEKDLPGQHWKKKDVHKFNDEIGQQKLEARGVPVKSGPSYLSFFEVPDLLFEHLHGLAQISVPTGLRGLHGILVVFGGRVGNRV